MEYINVVKEKIKGLTKIQKVLIVVSMIILLVVGVVLVNPAKKMMEYRNSQRRQDVAEILKAVYQYSADHDGSLPFQLTQAPVKICRANCSDGVNLNEITKDIKYQLSAMPSDPSEKDKNYTGYQISRLANGRIKISAPLAERAVITLSK